MFNNAYFEKRVLITGHTGFKGSWLTAWLLKLGANVAGYSIDIPTQPSHFEALNLFQKIKDYRGDVRDASALTKAIEEFQPEIIFHLAAQPLVRQSYNDPVSTFMTNAIGTLNILEAIRKHDCVQAAVLITSDKAYRNVEWCWGYRENDMLGGDDPYSASKACAENIAYSYMRSYFSDSAKRVATVRAGNVIGGGDWARDRIVPDCMIAWSENRIVDIRNPNATRPWQHVLEPLSGYLQLGAELLASNTSVANESFNFGPDAKINQSVEELIVAMSTYWKNAKWNVSLDAKNKFHEAGLLKLSCDKALHHLKWHSTLNFDQTVEYTSRWYENYYHNTEIAQLTNQQIEQYVALAKAQNLVWASDTNLSKSNTSKTVEIL